MDNMTTAELIAKFRAQADLISKDYHTGMVNPLEIISSEERAGLYEYTASVLEQLDWQPIETSPEGELVLAFWRDGDEDRVELDIKEDGSWLKHCEVYERYYVAGGELCSTDLKEEAPYTHWKWLHIPQENK